MRILSMTATFGKLEHQSLTFTPGLNVIEAPNEWGKSTWCAFIVAMLYGIDTGSRSRKDFLADKDHYAPWSGQPMSGRMDLLWKNREITLERSSKGRIPFGQFRAYETKTNIPVPELTADNCGQVLLGVEREVFARAGFLRMSALPVTQEEALRRRLNALVTTADESGASDALAQKLRDLKNRCRHNKTGLIPQAQAQQQALEEKLQELQLLQQQQQEIVQRQQQLHQQARLLENHQKALSYSENLGYTQKLAAAQTTCEAAKKELQQREQECALLPEAELVQKNLLQMQTLREQREQLLLQAQLLPSLPEAPQPMEIFRGKDPQTAVEQAQAQQQKLYQLTEKKNTAGWIATALLAAVAVALAVLLPAGYKLIGAAPLLAGICLAAVQLQKQQARKKQIALLKQAYGHLVPERWTAEAQAYAAQQTQYRQVVENRQQTQEEISRRIEENQRAQEQLTGGISAAQFQQQCLDWQEQRRMLQQARQRYQQAQELLQTLSGSRQEVAPPDFADTLTDSAQQTREKLAQCQQEQRQLQHRLGQCQGRTEALGSREVMQRELEQVKARLAQLEDTYCALTLAQETLTAAATELQRRFAPRISGRAQALFARLTGQRYNRLLLEEDLSLSAAAEEEDVLHSSLWRSEGTVDQLYFALRLAVAEELTPEAPLVLDDVFVRFDDKRLAAAMEILLEEARDKQVLLFTCQHREKEYLQENAL